MAFNNEIEEPKVYNSIQEALLDVAKEGIKKYKDKMTDLDIIKECRQTGRTRTTTKKLLEKAYDEQMTEIEKVKAEIKVLEKKLSFLEELEKTKTPVEEAFKRIYNVYPSSSEKSVFWTDTDEDTWIAFQAGYNAAYEEKVAQEPEELKTLHQMFYEKKWNNLSCDEFCDIVKEWMSQYTHYVMTGEWEYLKGYDECLTVLEENLK